MFEIECLTAEENIVCQEEACEPFFGECYPIAEG